MVNISKQNVKKAAVSVPGTTAAGALGGTGGYQLWVTFWNYVKSVDVRNTIETGITKVDWEAAEPLLTNIYIFLATGGLVGVSAWINRMKTKGM